MDNKGPKSSGGPAGAGTTPGESITPGFLGGAGGGEKPMGLSDKNEKGAAALGAAEDAATNKKLDQNEDNLDGARKDESAADDSINYTGGGQAEEDGDGQPRDYIGEFIKKPLTGIIGLFILFAAMIGGSQLSQPFSIVEQLRTSFNSMQTSAASRSNVLVKYQLDNGLIKSPYKQGLFGMNTKGGFVLSDKQKQKLSSRGITTEEVDTGSGKKTIMVYDNGSGTRKVIVAGDGDVAGVKGLSRFENDQVMTFKNAFENDSAFFKAYRDSSLTWRGAIANWFESGTLRFLAENKLTRNLFTSYRRTDNEAENKAKMTELITRGGSETVQDGGVKRSTLDAETDKDGNPIKENGKYKTSTSTDGGIEGAKTINVADFHGTDSAARVRQEIEDIRTKYGKTDTGGGFSGAAQQVANYTCLAFNFLGGVSLLVSAAQTIQMIHFAMAFLEAVDKVKAGEGDNAPFEEMTDALNRPTEEEYVKLNLVNTTNAAEDIVKLSAGKSTDANLDNGTSFDNGLDSANASVASSFTNTTIKTHKTAMDAEAMTSQYNGTRVNPYDTSVMSFNFTASIKTVLSGIGVAMGSFTGCSISKMLANGAGVVENVIEIASCVAGAAGAAFSFGATLLACLPAAASVALNMAVSVGAGLLITGIISAITPMVANMLTKDIISKLAGQDLGNLLVFSGNKLMADNHRYNGGSLGGQDVFLGFNAEQQKVIAEEARYDQLTKSPFDSSSQYTFLGTLLKQLMSFTSAHSIMSTVMSTNSALSTSVVAMLPTASAFDASSKLVDNYADVCPYLDSIGAVGDAICNPYSVTDMSTIGYDPVELVNVIESGDNFLDELSSDGNVQIKAGSDLAKYILFCDNRNSAFGIADQNIVNAVANFAQVDSENAVFNNTVNSAIGAIPVIGDTIDVITNGQALANAGYVSGESCVAGNTTSYGVDWDTAKKYQRFIEDQALMESMGMIEESAVTAFMDKYREENPLDNSYEGILARYSGLEKEDVIALLDVIEYGNYIANYDPTTRYNFGQGIKPVEETELKFDNDHKVAYIVLLNTIEFADVRNRNFVV